MKTFSYACLCEDEQIFSFLEFYLENLYSNNKLNKSFSFQFSADYHVYPVRGKEVKPEVARDAVVKGFRVAKVDVFFIGRDSDFNPPNELSEGFLSLLNVQDKSKTIIMIPVQCIEHWLGYLKKKKQNPEFKGAGSLESIKRSEMKGLVYENKGKTVSSRKEVIKELCFPFDIDWLKTQSNSFRAFHQSVHSFLKNNGIS